MTALFALEADTSDVSAPVVALPTLDERVEMFLRMVNGPERAITDAMRAGAREQILTAMAADLADEATGATSEPLPEHAATRTGRTGYGSGAFGAAAAGQQRPAWSSITDSLQRLLDRTVQSFSIRTLSMAAVPLVALIIAGSVLTDNWRSGETPNAESSAPKLRSLEPQQADTAAEQNLQHAIAAEETAHGKSDPAVARKLVDLASLYRADRRYAEAQALYERALVIQDRALGRRDSETLRTIKELAQVYRAEGRLRDADDILKRADQP